MSILHEHQRQSSPNDSKPTQFALLPVERVMFLVQRYEGLRVDVEHLPPDPTRPPLPYIEHTLRELRRELRLREGEGVAA